MSQNNTLRDRFGCLFGPSLADVRYIFFYILSSKYDGCEDGTGFALFVPNKVSKRATLMDRPWKMIGLAAGVTAVLAGSLLLMGSLKSATRESQGAELARVEALAHWWESRIEAARSELRSQIIRQHLFTVLEHPEEWAPWRIEPKLSQIQTTWPQDLGIVQGLVLIDPERAVFATCRDTSGGAAAILHFMKSPESDIMLSGAPGGTNRLALLYFIPATEDDSPSGFLIALLSPASILTTPVGAPRSWALMSDPQHALLSSNSSFSPTLINQATWPLLVGKSSGTLEQGTSGTLNFCRVHVPGMLPLLVVSTMPIAQSAGGDLELVLIGGGVLLLLFSRKKRPRTEIVPPEQAVSQPARQESVAAIVSLPKEEFEFVPDPNNPFPVLRVTPEGLISLFNEAALRACPRIKDTPLIAEVLPSLETRQLLALLSGPPGTSFESLFGSVPHRFQVVPADDRITLYAHPLSASQSLEVALKQAHESFNSLCAVMSYPVLLIDPRDHSITSANRAAASLFGVEAGLLNGRILDSLCAQPIDLTASRSRLEVDAPAGHITCELNSVMVKIEGVPTVLATLEVPVTQNSMQERRSQTESNRPSQRQDSNEKRNLIPGPGILVSFSPVVRDVARRLLDKIGHTPEVFSTLDDATTWLITQGHRPEFVCIDITDFAEAPEWLADIRRRCGDIPCVAISDGVTGGLPPGPNSLIVKPFDLESISGALQTLGLPAELALSS